MNRKQITVIIGMAGNFILACAKTILSLISGSAALIADALHSFSDLLVSILVLAGLQFNRKRIEAIVSLFVGLLIISVAVGFAVELFLKEPVIIKNIVWAVTGQIIIIIGTYILYRYKTIVGKEENSDSLIADGAHTKSDMLSSIGVLVSLTGTLIGLNLDRIAAFIIFFLILYQGLETIGGAFSLLRGNNESVPYFYSFPFIKQLRLHGTNIKQNIIKNRKRSFILMFLFFLLIYMIPGFYTVDESEKVVRTILGVTQKKTISTGLHFDPLYLVSSIEKIDIKTIKTLEYGFKSKDIPTDDILIYQWETISNSNKYSINENENDILTGDGSIININLIVEYRILDPYAYLVNTADPLSILRIETGSHIQKVAGSMPLFFVLNEGLSDIEKEIKTRLNSSMSQLNTGLIIEDVFLFSIHPHLSTTYIYRNVQNEEQNKDTLLFEAQAVKEKQLPYYRGLAYEKIKEAEANAKAIVLKARSDTELYKILENIYLINRDAVSFNLQIDSRNKILNDSEKILIDKSLKDNLIRIDGGSEE